MSSKRAPGRSLDEWMELVIQCRQSGLTDAAWCNEHGISPSCYNGYCSIVVNDVCTPFKEICQLINHRQEVTPLHYFIPLENINLYVLNTSVFAGQTYPGEKEANPDLEDTNLYICDTNLYIFCIQSHYFFEVCDVTSSTYLPHTCNPRFNGNSGSVMQFIFLQFIL